MIKDTVQTTGKEQQETKSTHILKNDVEKILHKLHKKLFSKDSYKIVRKENSLDAWHHRSHKESCTSG